MRIAISCDENPGDPGTTADPAISERDLNIKVAHELQNALMRCGQDAWFDSTITFEQRLARANSDGTHLLVACAHNAGGGRGTVFVFCPDGHASQTPTWSDGSPNRQDDLMAAIGAECVAGFGSVRVGSLDENIAECCDFNFDTAYVELLFMDSPEDQAIYHQPDYPNKAGEAIARGIAHTYGFAYQPPVTPQPPPPPPPPPATDPSGALALIEQAETALWAARKKLGG